MASKLSKYKIKKLFIGIIAIFIFYSIAGILHQRLMKQSYYNIHTKQQDMFKYPITLLIVNSIVGWVFGFTVNMCTIHRNIIPQSKFVLASIMVMISGITLNQALYYAQYSQILMLKNFNILTVILVGVLCSRVSLEKLKLKANKFIVGIIVSVGILIYFKSQNQDITNESYPFYLLIAISIVADGFVADSQAKIKQNYDFEPSQIQQNINKFVFIISFTYSIVVEFQISSIFIFLFTHPLFSIHLILFTIVSTLGQLHVLRLIKHFRQHVLPLVVISRKIFTIWISWFVYNHSYTGWQILGMLIILIAVGIELYIELLHQSKPSDDLEDSKRSKVVQLVEESVVQESQKKISANAHPTTSSLLC